MNTNSNLVTATLISGVEQTVLNLTSNGSDITDEFLASEYQEDTKQGGINELLKNILSMQQITNVALTEFVNKEKLEKAAIDAATPKPKSKKQLNKGMISSCFILILSTLCSTLYTYTHHHTLEKQQLKQQNNNNNSNSNKRTEGEKDDDKIVKQPKLD